MKKKRWKGYASITLIAMLMLCMMTLTSCYERVVYQPASGWYFDPNGSICIPQADMERIYRELWECKHDTQ